VSPPPSLWRQRARAQSAPQRQPRRPGAPPGAVPCLPYRHRALGAFCRRRKARRGAPTAITATAPTLARLVYRLLKYGEDSVAQGRAEYEQAYRQRSVQNLVRKAKALGYKLLPTTDAAAQEAPA